MTFFIMACHAAHATNEADEVVVQEELQEGIFGHDVTQCTREDCKEDGT